MGARLVLVAVLGLAAVASGCVSAEEDPIAEAPAEDSPLAEAATPEAYAPAFELVPPGVFVDGPTPLLSGDTVTLRATFPPEVDVSRVRDVLWDFGGGSYGVGMQSTHVFEAGGVHRVNLTARDVYDRAAATSFVVSVGERDRFSGTVGVGAAATDAQPPGGAVPHDHEDHVFAIPEGASTLAVRLYYLPESEGCPEPPFCVPGTESSLVLRVLGPDGAKLAEAATGEPPRAVEIDVSTPGDYVLRVSGERGLDVSYSLTTLLLFPEA